MSERLRLYAQDADDLAVISACLQDALTRVADMTFQPAQHRFAMVLSRFMWEAAEARRTERGGMRIRTGLHFDSVLRVRTQGIDQEHREGLLPLLAITAEEQEGGLTTILLQFTGGGTVQLEAECIDCQMMDMGEPWRTPRRPAHAVGDEA